MATRMHSDDEIASLLRLERSRSRWRLIAIGSACTLIGMALGGMQGSRPPLQAIALEPNENSGLWSDTLYGVDATGVVYRLNTQSQPGRWEKFKYSP